MLRDQVAHFRQRLEEDDVDGGSISRMQHYVEEQAWFPAQRSNALSVFDLCR
jgi:hypothetical protein